MTRYKLMKGRDNSDAAILKILEDSTTCFKNFSSEDPKAEDNYHYQEYLKWVAEGNIIEPADETE